MQRYRSRVNEQIQIGRHRVTVLGIQDGQVRFGIEVPQDVEVPKHGRVRKRPKRVTASRRKYH